MRVPMPEGAQVQSRELYSTTAPMQRQADTQVAQGLGNLAQGIQQAGRGAGDVLAAADAVQRKADDTIVMDRLSQYATAATTTFMGDSTAGTQGTLAARGMEASARSAKDLEAFSATRAKLAAGLNDRQRQLFEAKAGEITNSWRLKVETHVAEQANAAGALALASLAKTTLNDIASMPANTPEQQQAIEQRLATVKSFIRARQTSKEDGDAQEAELLGRAAEVQIASSLSSKNYELAERQLEAMRPRLGERAGVFQKTIEEAKQGRSAEQQAMSLVETARDPESGWVDTDKALAELDKLPAGPAKDETRARLEHRLGLAERQKKQAIDARFNNALSAYEKTGTLSAVNPADKVFLQSPKNDPEAWHKLQAIARADASHAQGLPPTETQRRAMTEFLVDANDNPDKYATMTVEQFNTVWGPRLGKGDRQQAGAVLAQMHGRAGKPHELNQTEAQLFLQTGRNAGVFQEKTNDVSKWGDDGQAEAYYRGVQALQERSAAYRKANGKPPPLDQVEKWTNELFLAGTKPGTGFLGFFKKDTTRLQAEIEGSGFEPKWTDKDRADATKALQSAGAVINDAAVESYLRRRNRLPALPVQAQPEPSTQTGVDAGVKPGLLDDFVNQLGEPAVPRAPLNRE